MMLIKLHPLRIRYIPFWRIDDMFLLPDCVHFNIWLKSGRLIQVTDYGFAWLKMLRHGRIGIYFVDDWTII